MAKIKIEPKILIEDQEKSNCKNNPSTENMIIHGDNPLALKALESKYAGQIKCIYIQKLCSIKPVGNMAIIR
ncbi:MAG: hypothetical protein U0M86_03480 [Dialister invisus]|uniref:hypothetical protein n=1 Tax=Dialister invisus TaxID=218538 RepID=UPI002F959F2A